MSQILRNDAQQTIQEETSENVKVSRRNAIYTVEDGLNMEEVGFALGKIYQNIAQNISERVNNGAQASNALKIKKQIEKVRQGAKEVVAKPNQNASFLKVGILAVALASGAYLGTSKNNTQHIEANQTPEHVVQQLSQLAQEMNGQREKSEEKTAALWQRSASEAMATSSEISSEVTKSVVTRMLDSGHYNLALIAANESYVKSLYNDVGGFAIGFGFNLTHQSKSTVINALTEAGVEKQDIDRLAKLAGKPFSKEKAQDLSDITLTPYQALKIVEYMDGKYYGGKLIPAVNMDNSPDNAKAVASAAAYNQGYGGSIKMNGVVFKKLAALGEYTEKNADDVKDIMKKYTSFYTVKGEGGEKIKRFNTAHIANGRAMAISPAFFAFVTGVGPLPENGKDMIREINADLNKLGAGESVISIGADGKAVVFDSYKTDMSNGIVVPDNYSPPSAHKKEKSRCVVYRMGMQVPC